MSYTPKRCSFCGKPIALGNGIMYVRNDATTFWFCSAKCRKNSLELKRDPRKLKWSRTGVRAVRSMPAQKAAPVAAQPAPKKSR